MRIAAGVLAAGVLAAGTTSVIGSFFVRHVDQSRTFTEPVHQVEVSAGGATDVDVAIHPVSSGDQTVVRTRLTSSLRTAGHTEAVSGGVLQVNATCSGGFALDAFCGARFDLAVPAGTAVRIRVTSGDITVSGDGPVDASTRSGDVSVIGAGGPVRMLTRSGDLRARDLRAASVTAQTTSGDVGLGFARSPGAVRASTRSGDIMIDVPRDGSTYQVLGGSSSGDRSITVPTSPSSGRVIDARSTSGDVLVHPRR